MTISLTQGLHRSLRQTPRQIATTDGGRRRDFASFGERVARLAAGLRGLGMKQGDRVGILALNSDRYLETFMAAFWAGLVVNPCNTRWNVVELAHSLDDCQTRVLIVDDAFVGISTELRARSRCLTAVIHASDAEPPEGTRSYEALLGSSEPMEDSSRQGEDLAGVFYTGGTTGAPKGVMLSHGNLFASSLAVAAVGGNTAECVYLHAAPMFHMADAMMCFSQVICGGSHVMIPRFDPELALQAIGSERVTMALLVPLMLQMLTDDPGRFGVDCSNLKTLFYGASPMSGDCCAGQWPPSRRPNSCSSTE